MNLIQAEYWLDRYNDGTGVKHVSKNRVIKETDKSYMTIDEYERKHIYAKESRGIIKVSSTSSCVWLTIFDIDKTESELCDEIAKYLENNARVVRPTTIIPTEINTIRKLIELNAENPDIIYDEHFIDKIINATGLSREKYFGIMGIDVNAVCVRTADGEILRVIDTFVNNASAEDLMNDFDENELDDDEFVDVMLIKYDYNGNIMPQNNPR